MSYDLTLFPVPEAHDASLAYQQLMQKQERESADLDAWLKKPIPKTARAEMQRIADMIKSWRPKLEQFRPASPLPWIELNDQELSIQFEVYEGMVSVTMPYFGDRAEEMMACVTDSIAMLYDRAGYSAYDPQLDRIVASTDLKAMVAQYRAMDRALPNILEQSRKSMNSRKPWWKLW